jgi:hypothetical protein
MPFPEQLIHPRDLTLNIIRQRLEGETVPGPILPSFLLILIQCCCLEPHPLINEVFISYCHSS